MNESSSIPVLKFVDAEPTGWCRPDDDSCAIPGLGADAPRGDELVEPTAEQERRV